VISRDQTASVGARPLGRFSAQIAEHKEIPSFCINEVKRPKGRVPVTLTDDFTITPQWLDQQQNFDCGV